jgi:glyoxylase-like metal-dependent hydrolase (beta-lactamase superfamily II)
VIDGVRQIELGIVNAYLLQTADGTVLIDTGFAHTTDALLSELGEERPNLILVTHAHIDHAGGLAALERALGVPSAMHPLDAELVRKGSGGRPLVSGPGEDPATAEQFNARMVLEPDTVEIELEAGAPVPGFPELEVIHAPGHCAGQVALLWRGVLIAADAASNRSSLSAPRVAEDYEITAQTLSELSKLEFDSAVFGHGAPLEVGAAAAFRERFG